MVEYVLQLLPLGRWPLEYCLGSLCNSSIDWHFEVSCLVICGPHSILARRNDTLRVQGILDLLVEFPLYIIIPVISSENVSIRLEHSEWENRAGIIR